MNKTLTLKLEERVARQELEARVAQLNKTIKHLDEELHQKNQECVDLTVELGTTMDETLKAEWERDERLTPESAEEQVKYSAFLMASLIAIHANPDVDEISRRLVKAILDPLEITATVKDNGDGV